MPRTARLDIAGILYHVLFRGIERRALFFDDSDRAFFLERLSRLLADTGAACLAWALMVNHGHLLIRPHEVPLGTLMQRLLTAYALRFNQRHQRVGHLLQNRFRSIPCQEDPYARFLVRYIHLNPIRAGVVLSLEELDHYPWTGHSVLVGKRTFPQQETAEVLRWFGGTGKEGRRQYHSFLADGLPKGDRRKDPEGTRENTFQENAEEPFLTVPNGVLGNEEFLIRIQREDERLRSRFRPRPPLSEIITGIAASSDLSLEVLKGPFRSRSVAEVRAEVCRRGILEFGYRGVELAEALGITPSSVAKLMRRKKG